MSTIPTDETLRDARDAKRRESLHEVQPFVEPETALDAVPTELPESVSFDHEHATD